jgi:hypothetical protein
MLVFLYFKAGREDKHAYQNKNLQHQASSSSRADSPPRVAAVFDLLDLLGCGL